MVLNALYLSLIVYALAFLIAGMVAGVIQCISWLLASPQEIKKDAGKSNGN